VAIAEMCIGGRLGATIGALPHDDVATALFGESIGRLVVEVDPTDVDAFVQLMDGDAAVLGHVNDTATLAIDDIGSVEVTRLVAAFTGSRS
jgi:phosphoribosylformylglycinamidine synthase